jgi:predicted negative regulator of RcsB-dependent stress response
VLMLVMAAAYAGWAAWGSWKGQQALVASALYEELERASQAGDVAKAGAVFKDMVARYPQAVVTQHGGLLAAKTQLDKAQPDAAALSLQWVAGQSTDVALAATARLRLAGIWLDQKKYDAALQQLAAVTQKEFTALVADRRGDVLSAQGQKSAARDAYRQALQTMAPQLGYRRLLEAKLVALGDEAVPTSGVQKTSASASVAASAGSQP